MNLLNEYRNGDYWFSLFDDGTLLKKTVSKNPKCDFPSSIDVKITNYCDLGCSYCHESSTTKGIHGDLNQLIDKLSILPKGIELALGGGNTVSHPDLIPFLEKLNELGFNPNITVNQGHLVSHKDILTHIIKNKLVKGVGISLTSNNYRIIKPYFELTDNIVFHIICGVHTTDVVDTLINHFKTPKILILGYKQFGFGVQYYNDDVKKMISDWYIKLNKYTGKDGLTLSFDNLSIEQLNVKRLFSDEGWDKFFMGEDGTHSMYIDAVKQTFAKTSRSSERTNWNTTNVIDYFKSIDSI
jgi:hypothetical protein